LLIPAKRHFANGDVASERMERDRGGDCTPEAPELDVVGLQHGVAEKRPLLSSARLLRERPQEKQPPPPADPERGRQAKSQQLETAARGRRRGSFAN